jgi:hypothetical protein
MRRYPNTGQAAHSLVASGVDGGTGFGDDPVLSHHIILLMLPAVWKEGGEEWKELVRWRDGIFREGETGGLQHSQAGST